MVRIGTPMVSVWHWYSNDQAIAAATFVRKCGDLEANSPAPSDEEAGRGLLAAQWAQEEHRSLAIAGILVSVAFLEAVVNELFASASHDNLTVGGGKGNLSADERRILGTLYEPLDRKPTPERYQLVLRLLDRQPIEGQLWHDLLLLVRLRNALVHFKPGWRPGLEGGSSGADKLGDSLATKGFTPNPFATVDDPFFPNKCLGHGGARWAWQAALAFADEFFARLGVTPVYDLIRDRLSV